MRRWSVRIVMAALWVAPMAYSQGTRLETTDPIPSVTGPTTLSACDKNLAHQVAVQGLNSAFETARPLSSAIVPSMGFATEDMAQAIDSTVGNYMNEWGLPGGAVAITHSACDKTGVCTTNLIFAKSYGYIDVEDAQFAEPDSRFRLASSSKAITAMAILKMVHDGGLLLNDQPFQFAQVGTILGGTPGNIYANAPYNKHLTPITVGELLHHAGGWNRDAPGVPDLTGYDILKGLADYFTATTGTPSGPPDCTGLLSYVESQPLQFKPGTKAHYANVGFCALSEAIRETSGSKFFDYLNANVLTPLGMNDTTMGFTQKSQRQDREAVYYDTTDKWQTSLFPPYPKVPPPYGGIGALEAQAGAGAIVSTAVDVAHFAGAIASGQPPNFPGGTAYPGWPQMFYSLSAQLPSYESDTSKGFNSGNWPFGMGWDIAPSTCPVFPPPNKPPQPLHAYANCNFIKDGGYQGSVSSVGVTADGYGFAAVFNGGDNTAPSPQSQIFWPGCNLPVAGETMPPAAATANNCALQAAYNHTAKQRWGVDFSQYAEAYTDWMNATKFEAYVATQEASGFYPSRLEGREVGTPKVFQFRGRFVKQSGTSVPSFTYGQSCSTVLSAVQSAAASTPLVSLQRFYDSNSSSNIYQAVWSAPIPQLP